MLDVKWVQGRGNTSPTPLSNEEAQRRSCHWRIINWNSFWEWTAKPLHKGVRKKLTRGTPYLMAPSGLSILPHSLGTVLQWKECDLGDYGIPIPLIMSAKSKFMRSGRKMEEESRGREGNWHKIERSQHFHTNTGSILSVSKFLWIFRLYLELRVKYSRW